MIRRPPRSTRTATLLPYMTLFRSGIACLLDQHFRQPEAEAVRGDVARAIALAQFAFGLPQVAQAGLAIAAVVFDEAQVAGFDQGGLPLRAVEIGKHTSELQSLMRSSYAVFCLKKKN